MEGEGLGVIIPPMIRDCCISSMTCSQSGIKSAKSDEQTIQKKTYSQKNKLGQGLPEFTPVEIVGYEVKEAGSPQALDGG